MKRFSAAAARQHFADVLDAAERGEGVVIERGGVQFEIRSRPAGGRRAARHSLIEWVDPVVDGGQWSWRLGPNGLEFRGRRSRRK